MVALGGAPGWCGNAEVPPAAASETTQRLLAKLGGDPLICFYTDDARALPGKMALTYLNKALHDPSYTRGLATLRAMIRQGAGADVAALWPDFSLHVSGPMVMAMLPGDAAKDEPAFKVVLAVLTPTAESAVQLQTLWPKVAPQSNKLFSALRLLTVLPEELPAIAAQPLPGGDLVMRIRSRSLSEMVEKWMKDENHEHTNPLESVMPAISEIVYEEIEELSLSLRFNGTRINDELRLTAYKYPDEKDAEEAVFMKCVECIKEKPAVFDSLLAATPGEQDLVLIGQLHMAALGDNLQYGAQSLERYMRGKKWSRSVGVTAEAMDSKRFQFLFDRLQGSFSLSAKPALSGDLRLTMATAINNANVQAVRTDLLKGLSGVGAEFESLDEARKIGGVAPLGATFRGRGMFGAPVLGLSPGWVWLCSNSGAYQELTGAFKVGKTMAAESARDKKADFWRNGDAVRLQIEFEKVIRLAYAAWLVSGEEGLYLGSWKVPAEMLPQPQVFTGLGGYRAGMSREGRTVSIYSSSTIPGGSLLLAALLQRSAQQIEFARYLNRRSQTQQIPPNAALLPPLKNSKTDPRPAPPTLEGVPPKIDLQEKP